MTEKEKLIGNTKKSIINFCFNYCKSALDILLAGKVANEIGFLKEFNYINSAIDKGLSKEEILRNIGIEE